MAPTTVATAVREATARLAEAGVPTPAVDAQWLVRHVTGYSAARLAVGANQQLDADAAARLESYVVRRASREPLQLIIGTVGFRYLDIEVRAGVFIPRPETEVLAGEAIARVPDGGTVVEPCTGTGAIACAIASESQAATVIATDISPRAVDLARVNARRAQVTVGVLHGDLLEPVSHAHNGQVDVLVSNPPYLRPQDLRDREPEVVEWDPPEALVSGPSGHEITDRLIADAAQWLRPGGWLLLEVDAARAGDTAKRAAAAGLTETGVLRDLTGSERVVIARRGRG